jgi:hypothetical protein
MMRRLLILLLLMGPAVVAQEPDAELLQRIRTIQAIDNHPHLPRLVSPGEKAHDYDALPSGPLEPHNTAASSPSGDSPRFGSCAWMREPNLTH